MKIKIKATVKYMAKDSDGHTCRHCAFWDADCNCQVPQELTCSNGYFAIVKATVRKTHMIEEGVNG